MCQITHTSSEKVQIFLSPFWRCCLLQCQDWEIHLYRFLSPEMWLFLSCKCETLCNFLQQTHTVLHDDRQIYSIYYKKQRAKNSLFFQLKSIIKVSKVVLLLKPNVLVNKTCDVLFRTDLCTTAHVFTTCLTFLIGEVSEVSVTPSRG